MATEFFLFATCCYCCPFCWCIGATCVLKRENPRLKGFLRRWMISHRFSASGLFFFRTFQAMKITSQTGERESCARTRKTNTDKSRSRAERASPHKQRTLGGAYPTTFLVRSSACQYGFYLRNDPFLANHQRTTKNVVLFTGVYLEILVNQRIPNRTCVSSVGGFKETDLYWDRFNSFFTLPHFERNGIQYHFMVV